MHADFLRSKLVAIGGVSLYGVVGNHNERICKPPQAAKCGTLKPRMHTGDKIDFDTSMLMESTMLSTIGI